VIEVTTHSSLDLKLVIDILRREDSQCSLSWQKVKVHDIDARDFLCFAEQDLEENSERGRVNSLSNAKRAIACRIDEILALMNFERFAKHERWNLPYKMEVVESFGVPARNVLRDIITSKRNFLEHEYVRPERREVRQIVDIAELFLEATDKYIDRGRIRSARVGPNCVLDEDTLEILDGDTSKSKTRFWLCEKAELSFDFRTGSVKLALNLRHFDLEAKVVGEQERRENSLPLRDCEIEDVKELMILLRKKGKA